MDGERPGFRTSDGPPMFMLRFGTDPTTAIFPIAGLVTAALYWWLATRRRGGVGPRVTANIKQNTTNAGFFKGRRVK
jgi:hypothetical protein